MRRDDRSSRTPPVESGADETRTPPASLPTFLSHGLEEAGGIAHVLPHLQRLLLRIVMPWDEPLCARASEFHRHGSSIASNDHSFSSTPCAAGLRLVGSIVS